MKTKNRFLTQLLIGGLAVMTPQWAMAVNTPACTSISNTANVSYSVGGTAQTPITSAAAAFKVGNKVNLTVQRDDSTYVSVTPNQTGAVLSFKITNNGNASQKYNLSMGNTAVPAGWLTADNYNATAPAIQVQNAVNQAWNAGSFAAGTQTVLLAPGDYIHVRIVSNIPAYGTSGGNDGDVSAHYLLATTVNAQGGAVTSQADATIYKDATTSCTNAEGAYVVFADTAAGTDGDAAKDGMHSDRDAYKTTSPTLSITKSSAVYWDPINLTSTPKAIPGAIVTYTISLINAGSGSADITSVTDSLATEIGNGNLAFLTQYNDGTTACAAGEGIVIKQGAGAPACKTNANDAETAPTADFTANVVSAGAMTVAGGTTTTIKFQATIQ